MQLDQFVVGENRNILERLSSTTGNAVVTLWKPKLTEAAIPSISSTYSGFLNALRMRIAIKSVSEQPLPSLEPEDTRAARAAALRDLEWKSPRKEIEFLMKTGGRDWISMFQVSLLAREPYYAINALEYLTKNSDFLLGVDTYLGCRIRDAGYGLLAQADEVVIWGSVLEQVYVTPRPTYRPTSSQPFYALVGPVSTLVRGANLFRQSATIINSHPTSRLWLAIDAPARIGSGIVLNPDGSSWTIEERDKGAIYAVFEEIENSFPVTGVESNLT